jgi:hypothetical protein
MVLPTPVQLFSLPSGISSLVNPVRLWRKRLLPCPARPTTPILRVSRAKRAFSLVIASCSAAIFDWIVAKSMSRKFLITALLSLQEKKNHSQLMKVMLDVQSGDRKLIETPILSSNIGSLSM